MNLDAKKIIILIVNDRAEEGLLVQEALQEIELSIEIFFVKNGEEILNYLYRRDRYADPKLSPRPDLILLDLNMPRKDGREALAEIKSDLNLRLIPIVVLTTSSQEGDVMRCYEFGANSFIIRPITFEGLVEVMRSLCHYWFQIVSLPPKIN